MLPLIHLPDTPTLLAGRGPALLKRLDLLEAAGLTTLTVHTDVVDAALAKRLGDRLRPDLPGVADIEAARLLFVAGLTDAESWVLATNARARRVPVNVEDVPDLCDLHVPAIVRRGNLVLTVSTGGGAPALAAALRVWLAEAFGPEWAERLEEVAALRAQLRGGGAPPAEVVRGVSAYLAQSGWGPLAAGARCRTAAPAQGA
ncbi:NAD(P)-dependent oxidoreductase [Roseomonas sp. CAU 1739]|uniref:precorrin-2 dehydrogenase/sirohydrochlorin ferrochelatase family protein n=1 Tax=Roseomonas sp. CAU 1739 TaxID=3140364 RepID=UPI00325A8217